MWAARALPKGWKAARGAVRAIVRNFTRSQPALHARGTPVVGKYGCPNQMGNRMHEYLNSAVLALVSWRPLLTRFHTEQWYPPQSLCEQFVHRRNWTRAVSAGTKEWRPPGLYIYDAPRRIACSARHWAGAPFTVTIGAVEWQQGAALAGPGAGLAPPASARAAALFALGADLAFGALLRATFAFDELSVRRHAHAALHAARLVTAASGAGATRRTRPDAFWLSVHVRHHMRTDDGRGPTLALVWAEARAAIEQRAPKQGSSRAPRCGVLLASDRDYAASVLSQHAEALGCVLVTVPRTADGDTGAGGDFEPEHGKYAQASAVRDLYLLSLGDSIVGNTASTFTMLAAELIASGSAADRGFVPLIATCRRDIAFPRAGAPPHKPATAWPREVQIGFSQLTRVTAAGCVPPEPLLRPPPPRALQPRPDCSGLHVFSPWDAAGTRCWSPPAARRGAITPQIHCMGRKADDDMYGGVGIHGDRPRTTAKLVERDLRDLLHDVALRAASLVG